MPRKKTLVEYPSDREMVFTRVFDAPRELVWAAYTDPQHVVRWWGPKGFTNTIHEMDVRPGGLWRLTMHGPDGTNYPNRIEFLEVVKSERLVFHHGDDGNPRMFHVTVRFFAEGDRTKIVSHMLFKTPGECVETKKFASEGHNSTMDRLEEQLAEMKSEGLEIVSTRTFSASRETVFAAFADPARLAQWWGPKGFTNTFREFDFKPGGIWRFTMHGPDGAEYHNESEFLEVVKPERIVFQHMLPMHRFQMTMIFGGQNGKTELTWRMLFESAADCDRFKPFIIEANEQNFDRLAAHLAKSA